MQPRSGALVVVACALALALMFLCSEEHQLFEGTQAVVLEGLDRDCPCLIFGHARWHGLGRCASETCIDLCSPSGRHDGDAGCVRERTRAAGMCTVSRRASFSTLSVSVLHCAYASSPYDMKAIVL